MGMVVNSYAVAPAGPTASPHRYWRIYIGSNSATNNSLATGISEMEMRESVGGADVTGSGTASADSTFSGLSAAGAFANDGTTTEWGSAVSVYPHWLAYDFGAGNNKAIVEIAINGRSVNDQWPGAFKIQSSDDGTTWTDEWWVAYPGGANGHGYTAGVLKAFTKPVVDQSPSASRHRYWRVNIVTGVSAFVGARDIGMKTVSGSVDETEGGTGTSKTHFDASTVAANAFDTMDDVSTATDWASDGTAYPQWIQYDFGAGNAKLITEISYRARNIGGSQYPTAIDFQYSDDGSSFTTVKSVSGLTFTALEKKTWTIP